MSEFEAYVLTIYVFIFSEICSLFMDLDGYF